ncbi:MAG: porin family protein [Ketobacter sp.]|nr:MAG: porin family protein [Ketobacter sp.]
MKKALITTAITSGLFFTSQLTMAEEQNYVGLQYNMFTYSEDGLGDLEPEGVALVIGGELNDNFRLEGRLGSSTADDNVAGVALAIDNYIGFYVKGGMRFADMVFPYVVLGYSLVDLKSHDANYYDTESDLSYGVGADVNFGNFQVGLEWIMLQDKSAYELENLSLTAAWRF